MNWWVGWTVLVGGGWTVLVGVVGMYWWVGAGTKSSTDATTDEY